MEIQSEPVSDSKPPAKPQVVRGARACTVCRAAKMKCVGAEDGQKQCQRCKRANVECIFEKHRRGRKPGSKLSEASKMLRRLEKGLNSAKLKAQSTDPVLPASVPYQQPPDTRVGPQEMMYGAPPPSESTFVSAPHFSTNDLPPFNPPPHNPSPSIASSRTMEIIDDDDGDKSDNPPFPAKLIQQNKRNSFFRIILNAEEAPLSNSPPNRGPSYLPPQAPVAPAKPGIPDPISVGLITESDARDLFDVLFLRLNPFINLFDPQLHTPSYVRGRCPFLFTTLIMAVSKFIMPEIFKECQKMANDLGFRAFQEAWKSVEVVQAFACLTYWRDSEDNRTWTYIGYACRMAVELGLNRYVAVPPLHETTLQKLERRNRERTYLVLFIHDRSLSTQTGRHWMLPDNDDLIQNSSTWHRHGVDNNVRPEDVIIAAFVELRRIAAETTNVFSASKNSGASDVNYEVVLLNCNAKLNRWDKTWREAMEQAKGEPFHHSFLSFFRLYVRVFLNYFGIASCTSGERQHHSVQAHSTCFTSAKESLRIVTNEFTSLSILRYGQETITVMTAYSAIILLKLLRSPTSPKEVVDSTTEEVYNLILRTADAYEAAGTNISNNAAVHARHARFLRSLVDDDKHRYRSRDSGIQIDPRLQAQSHSHGSAQNSPTQPYPHQAPPPTRDAYFSAPHIQQEPQQQQLQQQQQQSPQSEYYAPDLSMRNSATSNITNINGTGNAGNASASVYYGHNNAGTYYNSWGVHATEQDQQYYKNMFIELGFGAPPLPAQQSPTTNQHQTSMPYHHHMPQHANYGH